MPCQNLTGLGCLTGFEVQGLGGLIWGMPGNGPPQFPNFILNALLMILTHCWGIIPKPHAVISVIGIIGIGAEGRHRGSGLWSRDCGLWLKDRGLCFKGKGLGIRV